MTVGWLIVTITFRTELYAFGISRNETAVGEELSIIRSKTKHGDW